MQNPRAASGRRRATAVAGSLVVALAATTFSALPASATAGHTVVLGLADIDRSQSSSDGSSHAELVDQGLHIWTDETGHRKAAGYIVTDVALEDAGEPALRYEAKAGITPGSQLVVDFDGNGSPDGILVGESVYGNDWWASNGSAAFVKTGAPQHGGGFGSENHGTLAQWRDAFPSAVVTAIGYSLGSGVTGDGIIRSLSLGDTTYTFPASPKTAPCVDTATSVSNDVNVNGWDFSESRTLGSHAYVDGGLHIATVGDAGGNASSESKSAGYKATNFLLQDAGVPSVDVTANSGAEVGLNLTIAIDGTWAGNLVYEPLFGKFWGTKAIAGLPAGPNPSYQKSYGTLDEILSATFGHEVRVVAVGYSLGSGAIGDATIHSITAGCTTYSFTTQKHATSYEGVQTPLPATDSNTRGWTAHGDVEYVDGGLKLNVPGDWSESWIERTYDGTLASLGDVVDFDATPAQYVGIRVETTQGEITFEKEASYAGKWWSTSDFGVGAGMGYASFASLDDYITANPDVRVTGVRVSYTNPQAASAVVTGVTFGGVHYVFTKQKHATVYPTIAAAPVATDLNTRGWTAHGDVSYVAGGVKLAVAGDWAESWIERSYSGTLASIGSVVDFEATPSQYVGIHLTTAKGEITFEKDASYDGKWWSTSDFGVDSSFYRSFASLDDFVTANPTLQVTKVRLLYTNGSAASTVIKNATFGGTTYTFTRAGTATVKAVPVAGSANKAGSLAVSVVAPDAVVSGTVKVTEGKTVLGTATLVAGKATVKLLPLKAGTHTVSVSFTSATTTVKNASTTAKIFVAKATSSVKATFAKKLTYGTSSSVSVKVTAANGLAATGKVEVREGTKVLKSATLKKGAAKIALPKALKVGTHKLTVVYTGTSQIASAKASKTVKVAKATSKVSYTLGAKRTVVVKVSATGVKVTGKVQLVVDPSAKGATTLVTTATVKNGKAIITLPRVVYGTYKVSVKYLGTKDVKSAKSSAQTLKLS
ncbi:Ig-like domain-containing protein [Cellulomonas rhizosphaerae]|uniref:Ig-like domain repeat protein n=1 Tax=Cellulomonas rhizosphaerae TaxID=2293719 RepID=A0A413RIB6_9CELL|nr:Ig-like domain-containing protein [Cellulomonas rhizosphaerae]RHA38074.1 Ig-like domain repeat protein [Cellulomonas rhizosphaerae]